MTFHRRAAAWLIAAALIALPLGPGRAAAADEAPVIAAASNLQFALSLITEKFQEDTGHFLKLSFGSSGNLARQIRQGAPYEIFLSADERYVDDLAREGLTRGEGVTYAEGRLALMVPHGSPLAADASLADLEQALAEGRVARFAIANPAHAPYGEGAEEVLRQKGLWEAIRPRLVLGENVAQAAQFALSGNAEGGLLPYALALDPNLSRRGEFALVPAEWHSPLIQRMVLLPGAGPVAEGFFDYLQGPEARAIFDRYGYTLPGGSG
jgi:molybdate transport system substrate-binding protein